MAVTQTKDFSFLSWLVAITGSFLLVGAVGCFDTDESWMPALLAGAKGTSNGDQPMMQAEMVDLPSQEVASEVTEEEQPVELEVPPPVEVMDVPPELPELAEALVTEDVFVIPSAPRVETALRPVEPEAPKPKPKPAVRSAPRATTTRTSSSQGTGTTASGAGGSGNAGAGASRGSFVIPKPSFPSHLKSMGAHGTVRLSIQVGASGRAESVTVSSSSGYSALDEFAASWVRRNGRGPSGYPTRVIAPLTFILR